MQKKLMSPLTKIWVLILCVIFLFESVAWSLPDGFAGLDVPAQFGKVKERWLSVEHARKEAIAVSQSFSATDPGIEPYVIVLQDSHENLMAQENISHVIRDIAEKVGAANLIVGVEGATEKIEHEALRSYPIAWAREEAARRLMEEGYVTGAEHAAISSRSTIDLHGVEDPAYFNEHFELYSEITRDKASFEEIIRILSDSLKHIEEKNMSRTLQDFVSFCDAYDMGAVGFEKFIERIFSAWDESRIETERYPYCTLFKEICLYAEKMNLELTDFWDALPGERESLLLGDNMEHSAQTETARVYARPEQVFLKKKLALLDINDFHAELIDLSYEIQKSMALSVREKEILALRKDVRALLSVLALRASARDVARIFSSDADSAYLNSIAKVKKYYADLFPDHMNELFLDHKFARVRRFYEYANKRDSVFVTHLIDLMQTHKRPYGVLVAGGYHLDNVIASLRSRAISYAVISPRIERAETHFGYLRRMNGDLGSFNELYKRSFIKNAFINALMTELYGPYTKKKAGILFENSWIKSVAAHEDWASLVLLAKNSKTAPPHVKNKSNAILSLSQKVFSDPSILNDDLSAFVRAYIRTHGDDARMLTSVLFARFPASIPVAPVSHEMDSYEEGVRDIPIFARVRPSARTMAAYESGAIPISDVQSEASRVLREMKEEAREFTTSLFYRITAVSVAAVLGAAIITLEVFNFGNFLSGSFFATYNIIVGFFICSRVLVSMFYVPPKRQGYFPHVSIVIPAFNEGDNVAHTIERCLGTGYPLDRIEVIAVNDGSTDNTLEEIERTAQKYTNVSVIHFPENRGKREAMSEGILAAHSDIIVFIDSDTEVEKGGLYMLVQSLADAKISAVTGHTDVRNKHVNFLTRMQDVWYFVMFRVFKASESVFGAVACCPGCFSAYRRSILLDVLDDFRSQTFMGQKCTFGDDRSLTNLVLKKGKKVLYDSKARCATIVPEKLGVYVKQQLRWKRSWGRESLTVASRFMWKKSIFVSYPFYSAIFIALFSPFVVSYKLWESFVGGVPIFSYIFGVTIFPLLCSFIYLFYNKSINLFHSVAYMYLYIGILGPLNYYGFLTMARNSWITRVSQSEPGFIRNGISFLADSSKDLIRFAVKPVGHFWGIGKGDNRFLSQRRIFMCCVQILILLSPFIYAGKTLFALPSAIQSASIESFFMYRYGTVKPDQAIKYFLSNSVIADNIAAHKEEETGGALPGWNSSSKGFYIDTKHNGLYPSPEKSLCLIEPGIVQSDYIKVNRDTTYVLQFMFNALHMLGQTLSVSIEEYELNTRDNTARFLGEQLMVGYEKNGADYFTGEYQPSSANVNAVSITYRLEGNSESPTRVFLDGIRFSEFNSEAAAELKKPHFVARFDDGWRSQMAAARILDSYGYKGVFNVIPETVWDERTRLAQPDENYMSVQDYETLIKNGHQIGTHSGSDDIAAETNYGKWDETVGNQILLKHIGFKAASYTSPRFIQDDDTRRNIYRFFSSHQIERSGNLDDFKFPFNPYKLYTRELRQVDIDEEYTDPVREAKKIIDEAIHNGLTVNFMFHKFSAEFPDEYTELDIKIFEEIVKYVDSRKDEISVITFDELLHMQEKALVDIDINGTFDGSLDTTRTVAFDSVKIIEAPHTQIAASDPLGDRRSERVIAVDSPQYPFPQSALLIEEGNAKDIFDLPARLIKVPVMMLPSSAFLGKVSQRVFISFPEKKGSYALRSLSGSKYYVIDSESGDIVQTPEMMDAFCGTVNDENYRGIDPTTQEHVYSLDLHIPSEGIYSIVLETEDGTRVRSYSFNVANEFFGDLSQSIVQSYMYRSTENYKDIPRTIHVVDATGKTRTVIDNMPHTIIPEGNNFVTTAYIAEVYNTWGHFLEDDTILDAAERNKMRSLLMAQIPWLLKMQVGDGPYAGAVYQAEMDQRGRTPIQYSFKGTKRIIKNITQSHYSTPETALYGSAVMVGARIAAQEGDLKTAEACLAAGLRSWRFLDEHKAMQTFRDKGIGGITDRDERMLLATNIFEFADMYPDIFNKVTGQKNSFVSFSKEIFRLYLVDNFQDLKVWTTFERDRADTLIYEKIALWSNDFVDRNQFKDIRALSQKRIYDIAERILAIRETDLWDVGARNDKHDKWAWGSNRNILDKSRTLLVADAVLYKNRKYADRYLVASYDLWSSVIERRNLFGISFMTGYGDYYPQNTHDVLYYPHNKNTIPGVSRAEQTKGLIVEGFNEGLESAHGPYGWYVDTPIEKAAWLSNEPTLASANSAAIIAALFKKVEERRNAGIIDTHSLPLKKSTDSFSLAWIDAIEIRSDASLVETIDSQNALRVLQSSLVLFQLRYPGIIKKFAESGGKIIITDTPHFSALNNTLFIRGMSLKAVHYTPALQESFIEGELLSAFLGALPDLRSAIEKSTQRFVETADSAFRASHGMSRFKDLDVNGVSEYMRDLVVKVRSYLEKIDVLTKEQIVDELKTSMNEGDVHYFLEQIKNGGEAVAFVTVIVALGICQITVNNASQLTDKRKKMNETFAAALKENPRVLIAELVKPLASMNAMIEETTLSSVLTHAVSDSLIKRGFVANSSSDARSTIKLFIDDELRKADYFACIHNYIALCENDDFLIQSVSSREEADLILAYEGNDSVRGKNVLYFSRTEELFKKQCLLFVILLKQLFMNLPGGHISFSELSGDVFVPYKGGFLMNEDFISEINKTVLALSAEQLISAAA